MSGLTWIRIETSMFDNPKLLYLKEDRCYKTIVTHLEAMCYSGRHGFSGFVPKSAIGRLGATKIDVERLLSAGLWLPSPGGWSINGWDEYQLSNDEVKQRTQRAQNAAATRWFGPNSKGSADA